MKTMKIELEQYLDKKQCAEIQTVAKGKTLNSEGLVPKNAMVALSAFLGIFGVDRLVLGNKRIAAIKCAILFAAFVSIVVLLSIITSQVASFL